MPIYSVLKSLLGKNIRAVLKYNLTLNGTLIDIDTFLNIKLADIKIESNPENLFFPLKSASSIFLRGSSVKCIWINSSHVNLSRMENAARKNTLYRSFLMEESLKEH